MSNWEKDYEAAQREQERNQELKRHNDLLDRHSIQQRLASEEKNRLLENQVRQTEKQNEILQQQAIAEERRREQELKQKQEQFYKDKIFELKNKLIYSWEQYHQGYADDICEDDFIQMDKIIKKLLSMSKDEFYKFIKMILPDKTSDENILELFPITSLENIFYLLLEKTKSFSFEGYNYLDSNDKSYRVSLIDIQNRPGKIAKIIKEIINNSEFLKATFNHDFLINRSINDISIDSRIDENIRYKEEWDTGIKNSIFNANMEFIKIDTALEKELRISEE